MSLIDSVPLEQFLKYHSVVSISKNEKYVTPVTRQVIKQLSASEFGSDQWKLSFDYATRLNNAVESFNMLKQVISAVGLLGGGRYPALASTVRYITDNWDSAVCTPQSIQNYLEYYNTKEIRPVHPLFFLVRSLGIMYTTGEPANETQLNTSLDKFLTQYGMRDDNRRPDIDPPPETVTSLDALLGGAVSPKRPRVEEETPPIDTPPLNMPELEEPIVANTAAPPLRLPEFDDVSDSESEADSEASLSDSDDDTKKNIPLGNMLT